MNPWNIFYEWYERNVENSMYVTLIILLLQIPHFIWGGDVLVGSGYVANVNPIADFVLYGIDLLEVPLIVKVVADTIILQKKKRRKK